MMKHNNAIRLLLAATLFQASAVAQVRVCLGGTLDHLTPAQRSACNAKMQAVRRAVLSLNAPDNWHFILVCGEEGWRDYASYSKGEPDALANRAAETDFENHETFLRETKLDASELISSHGIIAQEVAASLQRSNDGIADSAGL